MAKAEVSVQDRLVATLGPGPDKVILAQLLRTVFWHGDDTGTAVIRNDQTQELVELHLALAGQQGGVHVPVAIAPIEPGEPTTEIQWYLAVRRI